MVDIAEASLAAFSNSRFAWPMDLANSGSFWGPQRNIMMRIATMTSPSYPTNANSFHYEPRSVTYKNSFEFLQFMRTRNLEPTLGYQIIHAHQSGKVHAVPGRAIKLLKMTPIV